MQAIEQHRCELLRRQVRRKIGTADISDEQCVAGKDRVRSFATVEIGDRDRDAFNGVPRSFEKSQHQAAKANLVAIVDIDMWKGRSSARPKINFRAGTFRKFAMPAHKIGMEMSLNDVFNLKPLLRGFVNVKRYIALRIHHDGDAFGAQHIRSMRKAGQIELLEIHPYRL